MRGESRLAPVLCLLLRRSGLASGGGGGVAEGGEDEAWGDSHSSRVISLSCGDSGRSCLEGAREGI